MNTFLLAARDRTVQVCCIATLILVQICLWTLFFKLPELPAQVAFWYNAPLQDRLAPASYLWALPAGASVVWLGNTIIGITLYRRYPASTRALAFFSGLIMLMATIAVLQTVTIYTTLL